MSFFWLLSLLLLFQCDHFQPVSNYFVDRLFTRSVFNRWSNSPEDCGINWLPLERRQFSCFKRMPIKEHEKREAFDRIYSSNSTSRVVGGSDAHRGEFPWSVSVEHYYPDSNVWSRGCNGAIVQANWVATAAHCFFLDKKTQEIVSINNIRIKYNADARRYDEMIPVKVAAIFYNPSYVPFANVPQYDIGLIRLEQNITFERIRRPEATTGQRHYYRANAICLPENLWSVGSDNEDIFWMTSYGPMAYQEEPTIYPQVLQRFMQIPREFWIPQYKSTMLAEYFRIGYASCQGDSGSPIAVHNADGRFFLAGVHVTTLNWFNSTTICGHLNGFAVRVNAENALNWIKGTIRNETKA